MRGKGVVGTAYQKSTGITPAYAGKSFAKTIRVPQSRDHPRLCGEKYKMTYAEIKALRITPAYAGKRYKPAKFQK